MKKLEDAMRRFGTPDHGRTAKRLRDFEAQLVSGYHTGGYVKDLPENTERPLILTGNCEARDKVISRQYAVIQSLQVLLNQKDEEIDMLRSAPPVRARDLWIAAGVVSLVLLSAYYGFM